MSRSTPAAASPISLRTLNRTTLARQGLLERFTGTPAKAIGRLAGLQAQHANQPFIALWSRLDGLTIKALETALDKHDVVRGTVMRSTLHLVAADDHGVLDVASGEVRIAYWGEVARRANLDMVALHKELLGFCREPRLVAEIEAHFDDTMSDASLGGIMPGGVGRAVFRIAGASGGLVHVPPSGHWKEHGRPRYIDAHVWLPDVERPSATAALQVAVERFLGAYGPASAADIGKWVGQPRKPKVRAAIDALGERIVRSTGEDGRELLDLAGLKITDEAIAAPPRFLSRWDSMLIAYDARDRILPEAHRDAVVKKNGDFLPSFLVDGFVAGLWSVDEAKGEASCV